MARRSGLAALCGAILLAAAAGCRCGDGGASRAAADRAVIAALGEPLRIAAGDLDGDGRPELVAVDARWLQVVDAQGRRLVRAPAPGGIQVLRVADIDGDGGAEILAGWGRSREHPEGPARISVYVTDGTSLVEELVAEPATSRHQVVEILATPEAGGGLVVAHFESKYVVRLARARRGEEGWELSPITTAPMATSLARGDVDGDGEPDLIVGRVYGDEVGESGGAFWLRPGGERVSIPVTGGVRSLAVADLDADGRAEVLVSDGWNRDYGRLARARLARVEWSGERFGAELLEESPGQYTLWDILVADLDGDGGPEIATRGSAELRVLRRREEGWRAASVAPGCHDVAAADLDGRPGSELVAACEGGARILRPR